jgi:hypothetical protein
MEQTDAQELLLEILTTAEEGKSIEFRLITSWYSFINYWRDYKATKLIIRMLKESADKLFKSYCREVPTGSADFTQLLAYSQLQEVITFYERDLSTIRRMLDEYDDYLGNGHFWYSFLGGERET